jgi:hypothetical protein
MTEAESAADIRESLESMRLQLALK